MSLTAPKYQHTFPELPVPPMTLYRVLSLMKSPLWLHFSSPECEPLKQKGAEAACPWGPSWSLSIRSGSCHAHSQRRDPPWGRCVAAAQASSLTMSSLGGKTSLQRMGFLSPSRPWQAGVWPCGKTHSTAARSQEKRSWSSGAPTRPVALAVAAICLVPRVFNWETKGRIRTVSNYQNHLGNI